MRCDIFCRVVDNFGDIGVSWRLAHQLSAEHGLQVRLWLDTPSALYALCPDFDPTATLQSCRGVEVRHWPLAFPDGPPAALVIEAFGCGLPENYLLAMAHAPRHPCWINLEYLSAEAWIEDCHGLASPHPRLPLTRYFFFPGFTAASGGLLRESALLQQRALAQADPGGLWATLGLPPPEPDQTTLSLFCYPHAPLTHLLEQWANAPHPVRCLLPTGGLVEPVARWTGPARLGAGESVTRGQLTLHMLPFLPQEDYDRLLWACDCNFARGEDSFTRAQWAARPMVWHIYPQEQAAHQRKLDAWMARYTAGMEESAARAWRGFHQGWNGGGTLDWQDFWQHRRAFSSQARQHTQQLSAQEDLVTQLMRFKSRLQA